jgi:hypothetical protein
MKKQKRMRAQAAVHVEHHNLKNGSGGGPSHP